MKKFLFVLLSVLLVGSAFAQKIGIDKKTGILSIDRVRVARVSDSKNEEGESAYTFVDLKGNDWVALTLHSDLVENLSDPSNLYWEVSSSLSDSVSRMKYDMSAFSFNSRNMASNLIVKKYHFFTQEGFNRDAVLAFFSQPDSVPTEGIVGESALKSGERDLSATGGDNQLNPEKKGFLPDRERVLPKDEGQNRVDGILTLQNGRKIEGRFSIPFGALLDSTAAGNKGKVIRYFYTDRDGKDREKAFKVNKMDSFEVLDGDGKRDVYFYIAYKPANNNVLHFGIVELSFPTELDVEETVAYLAADANKTRLYFSGPKIFISKKEGENQIVELSEKNLVDELEMFAADCAVILDGVRAGKYVFDRESMLRFVRDYDTCLP